MAVFTPSLRLAHTPLLGLAMLMWGTVMSWANNGQVDFVTLDGKSRGTEDFLISTWSQSAYMDWVAQNVTHLGETGFHLTLNETASGDLEGAEIQSAAISDQGVWSWLAQAPDLDDGAVFAMFLYRADHNNDPWLEFDFEFLQGDTTRVQLAVHMEDENGTYYTSKEIIDLGFDASAGMHLYEFDVTDGHTNFLIDNQIVWTADASVMSTPVWVNGEMKAFASLWAAVTKPDWAGVWDYSGVPMVGEFNGMGTPDHGLFSQTQEVTYDVGRDSRTGLYNYDLTGSDGNDKLIGDKRADDLFGHAGMDVLFGNAGRDQLSGGDGDDILDGGTSHDILDGGAGDDVLKGGAHFDKLTGGTGADTFIFSGADISHDTITDFSLAEGDILDATALDLSNSRDLSLITASDNVYLLTLSDGTEIAEIHDKDNDILTLDMLIASDALFF